MSDDTTPEALDVEAIRARLDHATSGPWHVFPGEPLTVRSGDGAAASSDAVAEAIRTAGDADFIAHSRADLAALLARVDELEAERDNARAWAWSQWHRYFDPKVTDQRHPPAWLDTIDVPAAWTTGEDAQQ